MGDTAKKAQKTIEVKTEETIDGLLDFFEINQIDPSLAISAMLKLAIMLLKRSDAEEETIDRLLRLLKRRWSEKK